jgi:hypothetical protein
VAEGRGGPGASPTASSLSAAAPHKGFFSADVPRQTTKAVVSGGPGRHGNVRYKEEKQGLLWRRKLGERAS